MFWFNFYQIAYIDKLIVFPSESNSESGIFTNILHSEWKYIRVKSKYVNVYYLYNSRLNNYSG